MSFISVSYEEICEAHILPTFDGGWTLAESIFANMIEHLRTDRRGPLSLAELTMLSHPPNFQYLKAETEVEANTLEQFLEEFQYEHVGINPFLAAVKQRREIDVMEEMEKGKNVETSMRRAIRILLDDYNLDLLMKIINHPNFETILPDFLFELPMTVMNFLFSTPKKPSKQGHFFLPYKQARGLEIYLAIGKISPDIHYLDPTSEEFRNTSALEIINCKWENQDRFFVSEGERILPSLAGLLIPNDNPEFKVQQDLFLAKVCEGSILENICSRLDSWQLFLILARTFELGPTSPFVETVVNKLANRISMHGKIKDLLPDLDSISNITPQFINVIYFLRLHITEPHWKRLYSDTQQWKAKALAIIFNDGNLDYVRQLRAMIAEDVEFHKFLYDLIWN